MRNGTETRKEREMDQRMLTLAGELGVAIAGFCAQRERHYLLSSYYDLEGAVGHDAAMQTLCDVANWTPEQAQNALSKGDGVQES
jgi:hypothetical protein